MSGGGGEPKGIGGVIQLDAIYTKPPLKLLSNSLSATGRIANAPEVHSETVQLVEKWIHNVKMF